MELPIYNEDSDGTIRDAFNSLFKHLTAKQKSKMGLLMLLIFISAVFDVFGLASILPLVKFASAPSALHTNHYLDSLYHYLDFTSDKKFLFFLLMCIFGFFIFKSIFGFGVSYLQTRFSGDIAYTITKKQFNKYFGLDFHRFTSIKSSVVTHHIISNPDSYVTWVILPLIMLVSELIIVLLIITGIAIYDIKLFLFIAVIIGPSTYLVFALLKKRSTKIGAEVDRIYPAAMAMLIQTIGGYIDIKLADKEAFYRDKYLDLQQQYHRLNMQSYLQNLIPLRANELVALTGVIIIFIYAIFIQDDSTSAVTMIGLFAAAAYRLMPSLNRIVSSMIYIRKNQTAMNNLSLYEDEVQETKFAGVRKPVVFEKEIHLSNLSFCYPGKEEEVLKGIDIRIKKGEKIGFIGLSGSGKTTLMNVLLRFYVEQKGSIMVDGVPLTPENTTDWRLKIGYVKQDIYLLDASIRENITLGDYPVNESQLDLAIKQASLDKLIDSLPQGVNTLVGERGSKLSGGQRQRISIARSLYRNAEILIFDEATSALDNQTEQEVTESIDSLSDTQKTIFIVAHRITTLRNCDRIYELKDGAVGGVYTYQELIEKVL
jgi:ABC-type multidrug transport system fused ATPase/permease subunit